MYKCMPERQLLYGCALPLPQNLLKAASDSSTSGDMRALDNQLVQPAFTRLLAHMVRPSQRALGQSAHVLYSRHTLIDARAQGSHGVLILGAVVSTTALA